MPSHAIRTARYDELRHELTVSFTGGRAYVYSLVPVAVADALAAAPSKGAYFNAHIRDRYPFRKIAARMSADDASRISLLEALRASRDEV